MPSESPSLTRSDAYRVAASCFVTEPAGHIGVEIEWLTSPAGDSDRALTEGQLESVIVDAGELPGGGHLTLEPGGQIELSSAAYPDLASLHTAVSRDIDRLAGAATTHGVQLTGAALDPRGGKTRILEAPRYVAMEAYFDDFGDAGRTMMIRTASIQVNLDAGSGGQTSRRWRRAHNLAPVLVAAFANSPGVSGSAGELAKSCRQAVWSAIDSTRTARPVIDRSPSAAWFDYAMNARVMLIRTSESDFKAQREPLTFDEWISRGSDLGWPDEEDLRYHLTTLFPPVRPRGWLELRMIDTLPDEWWPVPVAVAHTLLDDPLASATAELATEDAAELWSEAAHEGLSNPVLRRAAERCFEAVVEALDRVTSGEETRNAVIGYFEKYVSRGRSPADDIIESGLTALAGGSASGVAPTDTAEG